MMNFSELNIKDHVLRNLSGTEENVKIKIVLPLLARLGWDTASDCYFEEDGADILVELDGKRAFIVETKGWVQGFHYGQGLEYAAKLRTPWVVFTSGQFTEVHHALILKANLAKPKPVFKTTFRELCKNPDTLDRFLSKDAFRTGSTGLIERCRPLLSDRLQEAPWKNVDQAFEDLCTELSDFSTRITRTSPIEFDLAVDALPPPLQPAYRELARAIESIAKGSNWLRSNPTGQALNLEANDLKGQSIDRPRWLGLFGVYPARPTISKSLKNWRALGLSKELLGDLTKAKPPKDAQEAAKIIATLDVCVRAIQRGTLDQPNARGAGDAADESAPRETTDA